MALKAGKIDDFTGSMAKAMEDAFIIEWPKAMDGQDPPAITDQMRLMFVAIAQGVVNHLNINHDAFEVTVSDGIDDYTGTVTNIDTI